MRFASICSLALMAFVNAGDGNNDTVVATNVATAAVLAAPAAQAPTAKAPAAKAGKNAKATKNAKAGKIAPTTGIQDRTLAVTFSSPIGYAAAAVTTQGIGRSCPYNNCNSCTNQVGCYWTNAGCSNIPCSVYGFCAIAPAQCGGCQRDSQCGSAPRRCENGQCVGVEGDRACDFYRDCAGCLSRPNCLWDPNTVNPICKPKEQCDFTYEQRTLSVGAPALPPATACVRTLDRCGQRNFNGAQLDLNLERGIGCTNHGQCRPDQYCYSCSKCTGGCAVCKAPGVPVSGACGPAWRCPIDNDSIILTCPIINTPLPTYPIVAPIARPPIVAAPAVISCSNYLSCGSCTAANGCVWSGSQCYFSTVACNTVGCANTPNQCRAVAPIVPVAPNCAFNNCQNCAGTQGCAWSGSFCYYATIPCNTLGCANTAAQCGGCTSNSQCDAGRRCEKGACLESGGDYSCDYYADCGSCLSNTNCLWDPNELLTKCKPASQCDFTYRGLALGAAPAPTPAPATACVRTLDKCARTNFNGALLDANQARGGGCTNHGQCRTGEYCFSCSKCRGNCSPCNQNGASVSGACAPASQCPIDLDSINDLCPVI